jgi:EAL domain-containing protein (putative c-di-GMP-specific phosphodiesterase class I)/GGDEF domain-containing protein
MLTFPQLLLKNILIGIFFSICACVLTFVALNKHFTDVSIHHQSVIIAVAQEVFTTYADEQKNQQLARSLQKTSAYNQLSIKNYAGKKLFNLTKNNVTYFFPTIYPSTMKITNKSLDLVVEFQLDFNKETQLTAILMAVLFLLFNIFIVFASWLSVRKYKKFFHLINQQIKSELSNINSDKMLTDKSNPRILDIPELKNGINQIKALMSKQIHYSTTLEKEAYTDSLTQLKNRGSFVQFFDNEVTQDSSIQFGVLLITRCSALQTINKVHGYREGDIYLAKVANIFKTTLINYPSTKIFKLNSSDFACVFPNMQLKEAEVFAQKLMLNFNMYQEVAELDSVAHTGLVYFDQSKPLGELLALADTGISVAQTRNINAWYSQKDTEILRNNGINYGNQNWLKEIVAVIENKRISLLLQPIHPNKLNNKMYSEVLARFFNSDEETLPTAPFIAMAERLDQIIAIDRLVIKTAINEINNKNLYDQNFGINVSARSVNDEYFLIWLERILLREHSIAPRLIFEITEYGLQQNLNLSKRFIDMIHRVGSRVTVEHFGIGLTSFKFFRDLKPDFIKMDSTYTKGIDEDKNNQYFLRLMVDLSHRLGITVLAESVETQKEKDTLSHLFIDGYQGFYISKPMPL